jgi:DNA-binding beta-propeller fold protein YncE
VANPLPETLAIETSLGYPWGVAFSPDGRLLFCDAKRQRIYHLNDEGILDVVAGNGVQGYSNDAGRASEAAFNQPTCLAVGSDGSIDVSDTENHLVRRIGQDGSIRTVAGTGEAGYGGDGGPANLAKLRSPHGLSVDSQGDLFVADTGNRRVRRVRPDGVIETVAGGSARRSWGDGGPATQARLDDPFDVCAAPDHRVLVADRGGARIREIDAQGTIRTLAGGGDLPPNDGTAAASAKLGAPIAVRCERDGSVLFVDALLKGVYRIRDGKLERLAGTDTILSGRSRSKIRLVSPIGLAVSPNGEIVVSDWSAHRLFSLDRNGAMSLLAGNGDDAVYAPDREERPRRLMHPARGIVALSGGDLAFTDPDGDRIFRLEPGVKVSPLPVWSGSPPPENGGAESSSGALYGPTGLAAEPNGDLVFSETRSHRIRKISPDGMLAAVAGIGSPGLSGDGGPATRARFWHPAGLALDSLGNLYVADVLNQRIRAISPAGTVTTVAGGSSPASDAQAGAPETLKEPMAVVADPHGRPVIADTGNSLVRRLLPDGSFETVAGGGVDSPAAGLSARAAQLWEPVALAYGPDGTLAIADATGNRVWGVGPDGKIRFVLGAGQDSGDDESGNPAKTALNQPCGLAYDARDRLYILTQDRIWRYDPGGKLVAVGDSRVAGWNEYFVHPADDPSWSDRLSGRFGKIAGTQRSVALQWTRKPRVDLIGPTSAAISWETDPETWCAADYGERNQLDHRITMTTFSKFHTVVLNGLLPGHVYQIQVTASRTPLEFRGDLLSLPLSLTTLEEGEAPSSPEVSASAPDAPAPGSPNP